MAFDLLVTLPVVFYFCVVRQYRLPLSTLVVAMGVGLALSRWPLPAAGLPLLEWAGRLAAVGEIATLTYAAIRLRRLWRGYQAARLQSADFMENMLAAAQPVLGRLTEGCRERGRGVPLRCAWFWAQPEVDQVSSLLAPTRNRVLWRCWLPWRG
ncbi:MAG: hypothetical protein WKG07_23685 [Hymenobacter sp.]